MRVLTTVLTVFSLVIALSLLGTDVAQAQNRGHGYTVRGFVDNDGDGFNDLAPDHDGDGIPNGQDPDYVRPQDGTGNKFGNADEQDNDNMFKRCYRYMNKWFNGDSGVELSGGKGKGYGPGNGDGNGGVGPRDGTGYGPGDGDCDGGGPYGPRRP